MLLFTAALCLPLSSKLAIKSWWNTWEMSIMFKEIHKIAIQVYWTFTVRPKNTQLHTPVPSSGYSLAGSERRQHLIIWPVQLLLLNNSHPNCSALVYCVLKFHQWKHQPATSTPRRTQSIRFHTAHPWPMLRCLQRLCIMCVWHWYARAHDLVARLGMLKWSK